MTDCITVLSVMKSKSPPFLDLMYLEYFGDGVGDTKVQIVKEETDGKVLMEIMVDSLPSDK